MNGVIATIDDLSELALKKREADKKYTKTVTLCAGTGCCASGCLDVLAALRNGLKKTRADKKIRIRTTGCHGFCEQGPLMVIEPGNIFYCHVGPKDVQEIITETLLEDRIIDKLLYYDAAKNERIKREKE